jgi:ABC-type Fe3+-hydroxamate transport system substrate-binding protein
MPHPAKGDGAMRSIAFLAGLSTALLATSFGPSAEAAFPVTVPDDRGRAITIEALPERIIAVGALYAEIVVDLGALDRLIAVATSKENPAAAEGLPSVGPTYAPSVELIIGLAPDLVLGATDYGGERPSLEAAGVTVLTTPLLTSIADIFASIRTVGTAIGAEEESALLIGRIAEGIVESESTTLGRRRIPAAFLYASSRDAPPYAAGAGSIEHELILRAGGENVFSDVAGLPQISVEAIVTRDPVVIFTAPEWIENVSEHPLLQGVTAVRDGHVVGIRGSQVASTQVVDALRIMIEAFRGVES